MIALALVGVVLQGGQIRYFLPGRLTGGDRIRCVVGKETTIAAVPYAATSIDEYSLGGPRLEISRRPNGAVRLACDAKPFSPPKITKPYVIGPNGLALIRGSNTLSKLERIYGNPSETRPCGAVWKDIGLEVTFSGPSCTVLDGANVTGSRWSSLSGVHIGDSVAKMVWLTQTRSRPALGHVWVIGRGSQYGSELIAWVGSTGTVDRFTATLKRPPG
ncbi:MAG: hypothetical protein ACXVRJ_15220 [Gaiellaceae bacterium]